MGKQKPPKPPDAFETAAAEAQFNRVDTYGPDGSGTRYGYTDANGNFVQGVAPEGHQSAVTNIESDVSRALRMIAEPAALGMATDIAGDYAGGLPDRAQIKDRGTVAQSIFDRSMSMMRPEIDQNNDRLLTNLQARGLPVGSEAFNEAYGAQQRETSDMIARLAMDADAAAGAEQSRLYGLESNQRQQGISELIALLGGDFTPISATPSGNVAGINYGGMVSDNYNQQMQNYQIQQQNTMATAGAIGQLGAGLLLKSDANVKDISGLVDHDVVADAVMQAPVYTWKYKGQDIMHVGPMAQDFHALTGLSSPTDISAIDYLGVLFAALKQALMRIEVLENQFDQVTVH